MLDVVLEDAAQAENGALSRDGSSGAHSAERPFEIAADAAVGSAALDAGSPSAEPSSA